MSGVKITPLKISDAYTLMNERFAQIDQATLAAAKAQNPNIADTVKEAAKSAAKGAAKSKAAKTAAKAAQSSGILSKLKSIGRFLMGEWAGDVGKAYRDAKKLNVNTSIRNFAWGKAYTEHFEKAAVENATAIANNANKGIFKKCLSFLGRKSGIIFNAIFFGPKVFSAFKNDGIVEGLKETVKAAAGLTAFALGGVFVGMMGFTGFAGLVASLLVSGIFSMLTEKGTSAILGKSKADEREELAAQQNQLQEKVKQNLNPATFAKNNPDMAYLYKRVYSNEPVNPYTIGNGDTGGRIQYNA